MLLTSHDHHGRDELGKVRVVGLVLPDRLLLGRGEAPRRGKRRREGGVDVLGRGEGEKGRGEEEQGAGVDVEEVLLWRRSGVEREREVEREGEEREKKRRRPPSSE